MMHTYYNFLFFVLAATGGHGQQLLRGIGDEGPTGIDELKPLKTGYQDDYYVGLYLHLRGKGGGVGADYDEKKAFCESLWGKGEFELCPRTAVCPNGPDNGALFLDAKYMDAVSSLVPPHDAHQWAAISDEDYGWVSIGANGTCAEFKPYKFPPVYAAFTYCCRKDAPVWFDRSSGWGALEVKTYNEGRQFCRDQGMRLCEREVYCPDGPHDAPFLGRKLGNEWAPTRDDYNDWVQIGTWVNGDLQETCQDHTDRFGYKPTWGEEGITHSTTYILCCPRNTNSTDDNDETSSAF